MHLNPTYWLDLRLRVREKRLWIVAVFFVAIVALFCIFFLSESGVGNVGETPQTVANTMAAATLIAQLGMLMVLSPLAAAGRISQEREQRTMPSLMNTTLTPASMAWGKLLGVWTFIWWLSSLTIPFLAIASLWGGSSFPVLLLVACGNMCAAMTMATMALGFSGICRRTLTAYLVTGCFLVFWIIVFPMIAAFMTSSGRETILLYVGLFHHPVYPLVSFLEHMDATLPMPFHWMFCSGIWLTLNVAGFCMVRSGFQQEVY